ncbi:uncharacterized protein LOC126802397 isoform X2 [Argentina anserina]|uniref:uncharacterized protein LOC126802397 isoform X2 n=1 Tax=Argentina anserina TaxID=57926 RepID=UPI00217662BF|nr:uncharacterized protein LOC126802397 isoform X2 [Potentilla anserina]
MSSGFDLSNLFESERKAGTMFTSKCSATAIMAKIEHAAKSLSFKVGTVKDFKLMLLDPPFIHLAFRFYMERELSNGDDFEVPRGNVDPGPEQMSIDASSDQQQEVQRAKEVILNSVLRLELTTRNKALLQIYHEYPVKVTQK